MSETNKDTRSIFLNVAPEIVESGRPSFFEVRFQPIGGQEVCFESATAPRTAFEEPPQRLGNIQELQSLARTEVPSKSSLKKLALTRPWLLVASGLPPILGTADHHELYYALLQEDRNKSNPDDVLINFDAHDDVTSEDGLEKNGNLVTLADFVGQGMRDEFRKVWGYYVLVAPETADSESMAKNLPGRSERFSSKEILVALNQALKIANEKQSKIIITIDLDFFGALINGSNRDVQFNSQKSQENLAAIITFIGEHSDSIRLVHITESLRYAIGGNSQINTLYQQLIGLLS